MTCELKTVFVYCWRNKFLTLDATSIGEMATLLESAAKTLREMESEGVTLKNDGGAEQDYAHLVTHRPDVAAKFGMESNVWDWAETENVY